MGRLGEPCVVSPCRHLVDSQDPGPKQGAQWQEFPNPVSRT